MQPKPAAEKTIATPGSETTSASATTSSHYDREGYDEEDAPKLSPELIEYDKKIPLIAEPGDDRHNHIPKHIMDEVHDFLDDIHRPVSGAAENEARTDTRQLFKEESAAARARAEAILNVRPTEIRHSDYLDLDDANEAREAQQHRVAGPSFLGIGTSDYEYVYDDQHPSHWRRNFSLLVLLVLGVLAIVQWRSIRDMGLEYAKSGTINVHIPKLGEQAASDSITNQNNGNSAPKMSVDPTRNADAENAKLKAEEEAAKDQQSAQEQNNSATSADKGQSKTASAATPPAVPPADTATTDNVTNTSSSADKTTAKDSSANSHPAAREGKNPPSAMGAPTEAGANHAAASTEEPAPKPTRTAAEPARSKRNAALPAATSSPSVPGAFEMQQATILGQTPSAVPWLWSALGKGNPDAPVKLADMYLTGRGVEKSCDQGLVILRSAAARGNARASARLGTLYATGICVQQNRVQAYEWMGTAAGRSASLSSWAEQYRQVLWQQMTPEERGRVR